ncbi:MarR family winged helix-turn-helix transcriptional regulator [Actinophytocola gossypii]|uniref:Winged helix-turn-helix transcriptional regulator n=1 Tax=Actinophytocola gossypii TaxID=2812003 RepID=A0ABT2J9I4_9PSEU|nr:MarR family winged helix-turn-helix transcriptional regulator [Actinophytocola gossypii]MCT2584527.1 winged helix-turn-helix transcriptional regulator [Actinophytocola gossypii]
MDDLEAYRLLMADVYELAGLSRRTSETIARASGQTAARWHVLSVLSDGPRTVPSAARRLGLAPQSVQRVVTDLLADGQVTTQANPDHARSPLIALTARGQATATDLFAKSDENRAAVLARAAVPPARLHEAREVIRALVTALGSDDPGTP